MPVSIKTSDLYGPKGWRGSVKARHFIMALKDHFVAKSANDPSPTNSDPWAVKYIDIRHAQSILEAFDDDSSGFVTINEANNFARSMPSGWRCARSAQMYKISFTHTCRRSLPRWIAYWAIGNPGARTFKVGGLTFF